MKKYNETDRKIAKALKKVMLTKPFEKVTITDITEECGLNRLTFYYHYKDKYDLLNSIFYNELLLDFTDKLNETNVTNKFVTLFTRLQSEKEFYTSALNTCNFELDGMLYDVFEKAVLKIIESHEQESFYDDTEINVITVFLVNGCKGLLLDWVKRGMPGTPDNLAETIRVLANKNLKAIK